MIFVCQCLRYGAPVLKKGPGVSIARFFQSLRQEGDMSRFKITRERIRQIQNAALVKLKKALDMKDKIKVDYTVVFLCLSRMMLYSITVSSRGCSTFVSTIVSVTFRPLLQGWTAGLFMRYQRERDGQSR